MIGNLSAEKFDSEWRKVCTVEEAGAAYLRGMIANHYLGKWPAVIACSLGMFCGPFVVGVVVYADAPKQTSVRYGGKTWELARLWISDEVPRNAETWLISKSVKHVRCRYPDVKYLVSYADPNAGHRGTIYKAANWRYDGMTDGERKTPRCDYVDLSGKKYSRQAHIPAGVEVFRVPRVSKMRFVYGLTNTPLTADEFSVTLESEPVQR